MNKTRGFTLVELLATIGILAVVITICIVAYLKIHNNSLNTTLSNKKTMAKIAAQKYGEANKDTIWESTDGCIEITNYQLIEQGYLTSDDKEKVTYINPVTGNELNDSYTICYMNEGIAVNEVKYKMSVDPNGGTYEGKTTITNYYSDTAIITAELTIPTKLDYSFLKWIVTRDPATPNVINFKAEYEKEIKEFIVNYDCNGHEGVPTSTTHIYDVPAPLSTGPCASTIVEGTSGSVMVLAGWSTSKTGTLQYKIGQSVTNLTTEETLDLYAVYGSLFTYTGSYKLTNEGNNNWNVRLNGSGNLTIHQTSLLDFYLAGGGGRGGTGTCIGDGTWCYDYGVGPGGAGCTYKITKNISANTYYFTVGGIAQNTVGLNITAKAGHQGTAGCVNTTSGTYCGSGSDGRGGNAGNSSAAGYVYIYNNRGTTYNTAVCPY